MFGANLFRKLALMIERGGRIFSGGGMQGDEANWEPLLELAPEEIDDFMWMFEVELEDGAMVQVYKHWWTRGYVHLDFGGRAFVFTEDDRYEEVDAAQLLSAVLRGRESRAEILRGHDRVDDSKITWACSATRHRISRADAAYVIEHAGLCFEEEERSYEEEERTYEFQPRLFFFGKSAEGRELEVVTVQLRDERLHVIHAMPMRRRFGIDYTEALGWRR